MFSKQQWQPSDGELSMFGSPSRRPRAKAPRVLRVGGVPEHFNYPWQLGRDLGFFKQYGCQVEFKIMKCGTGQMIEALKRGEVDMIVALTEGLVKDIAQGSDLRLLATYVESPLCWAVSAGAGSDVQSIEDLRGKRFGISRYTSGSHLMALVLAMQEGWDPAKEVSFSVEGNFKNLRDSVNAGRSEAFMWETFTTKPYHDSGEVRRVGEIYTPWPAFMLAAREATIQRDPALLRDVLNGLRDSVSYFTRAKYAMPRQVAVTFGQKEQDVREWYDAVKITASPSIRRDALQEAMRALAKAGVLPRADYPTGKFIGLDAQLAGEAAPEEEVEAKQDEPDVKAMWTQKGAFKHYS